MKEVHIKFKLSREDFLKGVFALEIHQAVRSLKQMFFFLLAIVILTASFLTNENSTPLVFLWISIGLMFIVIAYYFKVKKIYNSNGSYQKAIIYRFDEENIFIETTISKVELKTNALIKFTQSENWLFIYTNSHFANLIPKRDTTFEDLRNLKEILDKNKVKNTL